MTKPGKAFILAAGLGKRMRPLTDKIPKPLVEVKGRSLLSHTLDHLEKAGVMDVVINTHHLAEQIPQHLQALPSPRLTFSHEPELLDTAGGIKKMLRHFKGEPFYVVSGDGLWTEGPGLPALDRLAAQWNDETMDILVLLQPVSRMILTRGVGDYDIFPDGRIKRSLSQTGTHMFTSIRFNHPRIFEGVPDGRSSYLPLLDRAEKQGRLFALEHTGDWHHLSTIDDIQAVESAA